MSSLLVLPQCAYLNRKKTFDPVQKESKQRINAKPVWRDTPDLLQAAPMLDNGITLKDAISLGLNHNPTLQAHFEELGIRKSDLIQAGFYTNPHLESIFRIPKHGDNQTNIEVSANFMLSDLWQVPLRKKVAQDRLEVKTYEIINEILQLRHTIQTKYLSCLYNKKYLNLIKEITSVIHSIKKRIYYRYQFGFTDDLDKYFAASKLGEWQAKTLEAETELRTSYIHLREILGSYILSKEVNLLDTLQLTHLAISQSELERFALSSHPIILVEQAKMARAKDSIRFEKSRIIDAVQFGIAYERDFEKQTSGVGPSFGIHIPLFNTNYGNIEHARFEYKQSEKTLVAQEQIILKNITINYLHYQSYLQQIQQYEQKVIPPVIQAIEFSKKFFDRMQMSMIIFLETQIDLFQRKIQLLDLQYRAAQAYNELELAVGAQLSNVVCSE